MNFDKTTELFHLDDEEQRVTSLPAAVHLCDLRLLLSAALQGQIDLGDVADETRGATLEQRTASYDCGILRGIVRDAIEQSWSLE